MGLLGRLVRARSRRDEEPITRTIAKARKASEAAAQVTRHNPERPDDDLRYLAGGGPTP